MMEAIETKYTAKSGKTYEHRSRTEARWAVFWDQCITDWDYERAGFTLGDGFGYMPDFVLHGWTINGKDNQDLWVEVKVKEYPGDADKVETFAKDHHILVIGKPECGDMDTIIAKFKKQREESENLIKFSSKYLTGEDKFMMPYITMDGDLTFSDPENPDAKPMDESKTFHAYKAAWSHQWDDSKQVTERAETSKPRKRRKSKMVAIDSGRLRQLLKAQRITGVELDALLNVSHDVVGKALRSGRMNPVRAEKAAEILGVDKSEIIIEGQQGQIETVQEQFTELQEQANKGTTIAAFQKEHDYVKNLSILHGLSMPEALIECVKSHQRENPELADALMKMPPEYLKYVKNIMYLSGVQQHMEVKGNE